MRLGAVIGNSLYWSSMDFWISIPSTESNSNLLNVASVNANIYMFTIACHCAMLDSRYEPAAIVVAAAVLERVVT